VVLLGELGALLATMSMSCRSGAGEKRLRLFPAKAQRCKAKMKENEIGKIIVEEATGTSYTGRFIRFLPAFYPP